MKTIKNQFALIVGIATVLGFAHVGARAEDTVAPVPVAPKAKPDRPARPGKPADAGARADVTELKEIIKNFQDQKKEFLKQQKELRGDERGKVREQVGTPGDKIREELKDSLAEAKRISREQARKLADEAKEAAKAGRKRD